MSLVKEPPAYRVFRTALAVGAALLGSGCDLSHAPVLDPKGPIALAERDLLFTAVILMLIVVIPVFAMTFLFAWRYRSSNSSARYSPNWS
jgi:cytochrome o ubiquinol oxidase subunit 2